MKKQKKRVYGIKRGRWYFQHFGNTTGSNWGGLDEAQLFTRISQARPHMTDRDKLVLLEIKEIHQF